MSIKYPPSHYTKIISGLENEIECLKKAMKSKVRITPDNLEDIRTTLETLFCAKMKKHVEILRLESAQKKTELRIFLKKNLLERFSLFNSQNIDEMVCS